jgi:hypothetical protein
VNDLVSQLQATQLCSCPGLHTPKIIFLLGQSPSILIPPIFKLPVDGLIQSDVDQPNRSSELRRAATFGWQRSRDAEGRTNAHLNRSVQNTQFPLWPDFADHFSLSVSLTLIHTLLHTHNLSLSPSPSLKLTHSLHLLSTWALQFFLLASR